MMSPLSATLILAAIKGISSTKHSLSSSTKSYSSLKLAAGILHISCVKLDEDFPKLYDADEAAEWRISQTWISDDVLWSERIRY